MLAFMLPMTTGFAGLTGKQAALRFMDAARYDLATLWTEELIA